MRIVVQKYGGSSVASVDKLQYVAEKIVATKRTGAAVTVVVSAMGDTTDELLSLARAVTSTPCCRELDMLLSAGERIAMSLLSMAIHALGEDAISLTGPQAGIITNEMHTNARIVRVQPQRVQEELAHDKIVIVAGYQGQSVSGEVTTLGRGGSDTSAVALAAALQAECCQIYSDVDGIYSADPQRVPTARRLPSMGYGAMQALAQQGAQVLNREAVELARQHQVALYALSTFDSTGGTRIGAPEALDDHAQELQQVGHMVGIAGRKDLLGLYVTAVGKGQTTAAHILEAVTESDVFYANPDAGPQQLAYLIAGENVPDMDALAQRLCAACPDTLRAFPGLGSVAVIGGDVEEGGPILQEMCQLLQQQDYTCLASFSSRTVGTCILPAAQVDTAMQLMHQAFVDVPRLTEVHV